MSGRSVGMFSSQKTSQVALSGSLASSRIYLALAVLNTLTVILGLLLTIIGVEATESVHRHINKTDTPRLWFMGILPLTLGVTGILTLVLQRGIFFLLWSLVVSIATPGAYVFFISSGCFDANSLGISGRVFGKCRTVEQTCMCEWAGKSASHSSVSCEEIRRVTILYIVLMILLVVSLVILTVSTVLAAIRGCCLRCCVKQNQFTVAIDSFRGTDVELQPLDPHCQSS